MVLINSNGLTYARDSIKCKHKTNYPQELCESSIGTYYIHRGSGSGFLSVGQENVIGGGCRTFFPLLFRFV